MQWLREQRVIDYSLLVGVSVREGFDAAAHRAAWIAERRDELASLHAAFAREAASRAPLAGCFDLLTLERFCARAYADSSAAHPRLDARGGSDASDAAEAVGLYGGFARQWRDGLPTVRRAPDGARVEGEALVFLGVIDIFVPFSSRKAAEHQTKRVLAGGAQDFSVVPPDAYADRFLGFITSIIQADAED